MMKNAAGYGYAVLATMVGLSLSVATPEVLAGTPTSATAPGAPSGTAVVNTTIGGLATSTPRLRFAIHTHGSFPVTAVTVALPAGLAFSKKAADVDHGVRIGSDTPQSSVHQGQLTVTLPRASTSFVLTIAGAAVTESPSLEHTVTQLLLYNQAHMKHRRALPLKLAVTVASGKDAAIRVTDTVPFR